MAVRKVAITLPEELYELVERARKVEHRTRSELIQEALRTHFGEPVYTPTEAERRMLDEALDEAAPGSRVRPSVAGRPTGVLASVVNLVVRPAAAAEFYSPVPAAAPPTALILPPTSPGPRRT